MFNKFFTIPPEEDDNPDSGFGFVVESASAKRFGGRVKLTLPNGARISFTESEWNEVLNSYDNKIDATVGDYLIKRDGDGISFSYKSGRVKGVLTSVQIGTIKMNLTELSESAIETIAKDEGPAMKPQQLAKAGGFKVMRYENDVIKIIDVSSGKTLVEMPYVTWKQLT